VPKPDRGLTAANTVGVRLESPARHRPKEPPLLISFLYLSLRKLIELLALRSRSSDYEEQASGRS
jgi:hypothetical protein